MRAGHANLCVAKELPIVVHIVIGVEPAGHMNVLGLPVTVVAGAKGDHLFAGHLGHGLYGIGVVAIIDHRARGLVGKFDECLLNVLQIAKEIQVIPVNVQHHRNVRIHMQKGVVVFATFTYKVLAVAVAAVGVNGRQLAADDGAGVQPCLQQHLGGHRRGSSLAVGAADADAVGENAAHGAQQLRPLKAGVMRLSPFQLLIAL